VNRLRISAPVRASPGAGRPRLSGRVIGARLSRLLADLRRIVKGSLAFLGYLLSARLIEIGIGELSADSTAAVRGGQNRYLITICSAGTEPLDVTLVIDIHATDSPTGSGAHYARFSKHLTAAPRASTRVEVRYDWLTTACFVVDDLPFPPDDLSRGTLPPSVRYSVNATLIDPSGDHPEVLTVYQELAP
jgi:hypothetical protein